MINISRHYLRARQILKTQGLLRLIIATIRYPIYRTVKWWQDDSRLLGRIVELLGNKFIVDNVVVNLDSDCIDTRLKSRFIKNAYEESERYFIRKYLPRDLPIIELGACIGVVSCIINKRLHSPKKHLAVEANPNLIRLLRINRDRNHCQFEILNTALAYGEDQVTFYLHPNFLGGSVQRKTDRYVMSSTTTLELLAKRYHFDKCAIVCDVEGTEIELVVNELEYLKHHVPFFLVQFHDFITGLDKINQADKSLRAAGFELIEELALDRLYLMR